MRKRGLFVVRLQFICGFAAFSSPEPFSLGHSLKHAVVRPWERGWLCRGLFPVQLRFTCDGRSNDLTF